ARQAYSGSNILLETASPAAGEVKSSCNGEIWKDKRIWGQSDYRHRHPRCLSSDPSLLRAGLGLLIWIRIPGPIHSYVVIREYERPGGTTYFHFLHVATAASGFCNRAGLHIAMLASDRIRGVAGEAFAVVTGVISHQRLVRVMTSDAAESPIASVEAFTI